MTDLKSNVNPLFLREEDLRQGIELLFYGWRDFTAGADPLLASAGLGRAHHRALYFIGRNPGLTVTGLLRVLKITKQSLSRVLRELVEAGYVVQGTGTRDRRQRTLQLTESGRDLERRLTEAQRERLSRAYRAAGAEAVDGFRKVLMGLVDEDDRGRLLHALRPAMVRA